MRCVLNKHLVIIVLISFVCQVVPARVLCGDKLVPGKKTSDEAASWVDDEAGVSDEITPLRFAVTMSHNYSQPDTTEYEFPEEEEKHLVRDIVIFTIVSAFVAYFFIKVFLEGDKEEPPPPDNGKQPPPS